MENNNLVKQIYDQEIEKFNKKWNEKFPQVSEKERYTSDKNEIINHYVDRFIFCDEYKPKILELKKLSQKDITIMHIVDTVRKDIYKDVVKTHFATEINEKYLNVKNKKIE